MINKNLSLLAALFVSIVLLGSGTLMVSSMILDMARPYEDQDDAGKILKIDMEQLVEEENTVYQSQVEKEEQEEEETSWEKENSSIDRFSSFEDFKGFLENHTYVCQYPYYDGYVADDSIPFISSFPNSGPTAQAPTSFFIDLDDSDLSASGKSISQPDHSETNIQVTGVDEGDIVKTDGNFVYIVTNNQRTVVIVKAYPAEEAKIVSVIRMDVYVSEIYVHDNTLVVLGNDYSKGLFVSIFDIKDRCNPYLFGRFSFASTITNSRMIGDYLYLIASTRIYPQVSEDKLPIPADHIYYFRDYNYTKNYCSLPLTTIISINVTNPFEGLGKKAILMGNSQDIYVSSRNMYITYTDYKSSNGFYANYQNGETTTIHRISIENGRIIYKGAGDVPGRVLNRFSMDEHEEFFRIVTSTGYVSKGQGTARTHLFILDMDLKIKGTLNDIAPGEQLYSARFMGDRAYLVTFKKVDPFFVIDLSNPSRPRVLGELKIPGFSDYLHPYDENHVIGLGKDTYDMGTFAWYQGVKLSLFDVTDLSNPREISKFIIGDRGTYSPAQSDPHAFLFSKERNLLAIPIQLYEINRTKYPSGAPPSTQGEYIWNGVYVLNISTENGFTLRGRITHVGDSEIQEKSWYRSSYSSNIKRSFYIDNVLYSLSETKLKMNNLDSLAEIGTVELRSFSANENPQIEVPMWSSSP